MNKMKEVSIRLDPENTDGSEDIYENNEGNYIKLELLFNSLMKEVFKGSNTGELIQTMFVQIKIQAENP